MYVVTNRNVVEGGTGDQVFGAEFNGKRPHELRLAIAQKGTSGTWNVDILEEPAGVDGGPLPSRTAFLALQDAMNTKERSCCFFIHGYNNSFAQALDAACSIEENYDVEVVLFSWPSLGGGGVDGTVNYFNDKQRAKDSVTALDRAFRKLADYLREYGHECTQSFNLLAHSMGNYLLKHLLKSSLYEGETLLFDNVLLASADVNQHDHVEWVDRVAHRRRLYVVINEDDKALRISKVLPGGAQKVRLGHTTRPPHASQAHYIDMTDASWIGSEHSYFRGTPLRNSQIKGFFKKALRGLRAERDLPYDITDNLYFLK